MCKHNDRGLVNNIYEFQSFIASGTKYMTLVTSNQKKCIFSILISVSMNKTCVYAKTSTNRNNEINTTHSSEQR